jgi:O-acetyl-ADP-ribose deacetylase (regulator of RNase III)
MGTKELIRGDITKMKVDAIVNAANSALRGGGGVDGAIHRAGGPEIMEACQKIGGCPTGEAVITTAGRLSAKYVIHTVGPVWGGGHDNERELLAKAYKSSLNLAAQHGVRSIAFPNISTGVYGFPKEQAAAIAIETCRQFQQNSNIEMDVAFVCFDEENYHIYHELLV